MDRGEIERAMRIGDRAAGQRRGVRNGLPLEPDRSAPDPSGLVARALALLRESNAGGNDLRLPDLPLQRRVLSDGTECSLPIRYFDVQCLVATFLADPAPAAELLKGTGLQAVPQEAGKAVVLLYCIEYRVTDIGPYNEVGLTVLARAPGDPVPAIYVANLPVTTAAANRAGREIWGYNKFVAAIQVRRDGNNFSTILRDTDGAAICTFEGSFGALVQAPPTDIVTFTQLDGKLLKTLIQVLTPARVGSGEGFMLSVGTSRHPMAKNLRTLGLDGARPVGVNYSDPFQALLFPGRAL
jgi:hypothetical protein